jgi:hypothetical protein
MHQIHHDNHGPSTTYTTDDSIHTAGDEQDGDAPLQARCRNLDHPNGPSRENKRFISYKEIDAVLSIIHAQSGIKIDMFDKIHTN